NMADIVWETLKKFGIENRIIAFVMDNATNNDTMIEAIELKCHEEGIQFSAQNARIRCMPHTVHLAAIKLLESIGAITKEDKKKAERSGNYQETATLSVDRSADEEAVLREDNDVPADDTSSSLRKIVVAVRSSPQRKKSWLSQALTWLQSKVQGLNMPSTALMLILDVRTRWASTHQMLRTRMSLSSPFSRSHVIYRACLGLSWGYRHLCHDEPGTSRLRAGREGLGCNRSRLRMAQAFPSCDNGYVND
ncbi:hypothetical protein BDZ89DRAFT_954926, partial [Hymenopellis radicata]